MAVYTPVKREALKSFLGAYPVGELVAFHGIRAGIENTNYFVTTEGGEFVLTLFEALWADELPFFLALATYLAEHGIPCAQPIADRTGSCLGTLAGRPASLVQRLRGTSIVAPTYAACRSVGRALAELHIQARAFPGEHPDARGLRWQENTAQRLRERLPGEEAALLDDEFRRILCHRRGNEDSLRRMWDELAIPSSLPGVVSLSVPK